MRVKVDIRNVRTSLSAAAVYVMVHQVKKVNIKVGV